MSPFFGFNKRKNGVVLSNSFICRHCFLSEIISAFQKEALLMSYGPSWLHDSANVFSPRASGPKPLRVKAVEETQPLMPVFGQQAVKVVVSQSTVFSKLLLQRPLSQQQKDSLHGTTFWGVPEAQAGDPSPGFLFLCCSSDFSL